MQLSQTTLAYSRRDFMNETYCFKRFSVKLKLQLTHNVDTKPCFCFDIIYVFVPTTIIWEDKTYVFIWNYFVNSLLFNIQRRVERFVMLCFVGEAGLRRNNKWSVGEASHRRNRKWSNFSESQRIVRNCSFLKSKYSDYAHEWFTDRRRIADENNFICGRGWTQMQPLRKLLLWIVQNCAKV